MRKEIVVLVVVAVTVFGILSNRNRSFSETYWWVFWFPLASMLLLRVRWPDRFSDEEMGGLAFFGIAVCAYIWAKLGRRI